MKDIAFIATNYKFMVTEAPAVKTKENDAGEIETVVDKRTKEVQFIVMLFAKPKAAPGERVGKGEEIKVNLPADPGDGFHEGTYVELINPVLNTYEMTNKDGRITGSGLWFKAEGLKPAGQGAASLAA